MVYVLGGFKLTIEYSSDLNFETLKDLLLGILINLIETP